jgi:hypothetical protein
MRLQVLHLPGPADEYPFALVIDQASETDAAPLRGPESAPSIKEATGAKAVLVFSQTVEVL